LQQHWVSLLQDMKQLRVTGSQVKGAQSVVPFSRQVPLPSQVLGLVRIWPAQVAASQTVPAE
jgi:hypothetical protein